MEEVCVGSPRDWFIVEDNVDWDSIESHFSSGLTDAWDTGAYNQSLPFHRRPDLQVRDDPDEIFVPPCFNDECPIPMPAMTATLSADVPLYEEAAKKNIKAQPLLKHFIEEFNWEEADTLHFKDSIIRLLEDETICEHLQALDLFEDPLKQCLVLPTLVRKGSEPIPASRAPKGGDGPNKSNSDLDYLAANWFTQSFSLFELFCAEFKTAHFISGPIRIWSANSAVKHCAEQNKFKEWAVLSDDYHTAHVYVFGQGEFDSGIARVVRNIWGLSFSADLLDLSLPCDVFLPRVPNSVALKVPVFDGKLACHREFTFCYYKNLVNIVPASGIRFTPSSVFDKGWKKIHYDPIQKKKTESWHYSVWGNSIGIAASTQIPQMAGHEIALRSDVAKQTTLTPPHFAYFKPAIRCARNAIPFQSVSTGMLEDEVFLPHNTGDEIAHLKLSVGRTTIGLQVDTETGAHRYILDRESSFPSTYFGWAILDAEGYIVNPQFYSTSGRRGMSPINGMSAPCYAALCKIGKVRWRSQTPALQVAISPTAQSCRQWIIPKYQPCSWLVHDGRFFPSIAHYHPQARCDFKYFNPPNTTSDAFHLFAAAVGLNNLYSSDRYWESEHLYLGKRDLSW